MSAQNAITFEPDTALHQCFFLFPYLWRRWHINFKPNCGLHKAQWDADN